MNNQIQLPVEHLSYSAIRSLLTNPAMFRKRYIMGLWDDKTSPAMAVGSAFHKYAELTYKGYPHDKAFTEAAKSIQLVSNIDFGTTGSVEKCMAEFTRVVDFFNAGRPVFEKVVGVELSAIAPFSLNDKTGPLPIKAVTDLVYMEGDKLKALDWKVVSRFTDPEVEDGTKIIQAMCNFITLKAKFGIEPTSLVYWEIKKSKNSDGSSQVSHYEIDYTAHPEYKDYFSTLYSAVCRVLGDPNYVFLPNIGDQMDGKEAWSDFVLELNDFEAPVQFTHKSLDAQVVKTTAYTESATMRSDLSPQEIIYSKLLEFGITTEFVEAHRGASVTLYKFKIGRGIPLKSIQSHSDDIKLALGAKSLRVLQVPGTKFLGIEAANDKQDVVTLDESVLAPDSLFLPVGVDIYGQNYSINLAKAPHLLVAGTTGSGKSVCVNNMIQVLMAQNSPSHLRFVLIDPKRLEFAQYKGSSFVMNLSNTASQAKNVLESLVALMEKRYLQMEELGVKDAADTDLPRIVVVIDELADLLLSTEKYEEQSGTSQSGSPTFRQASVAKNIEASIVSLAQKARACGIHLILATQRPSVNVITGLIKANIPTRLGLMTATSIDSKVILDQPGCETLIGNGDMFAMVPGEKELIRLQGYYK